MTGHYQDAIRSYRRTDTGNWPSPEGADPAAAGRIPEEIPLNPPDALNHDLL